MKPDVVVLCGGLGTRLREVLPDRPKVLAPFGKKCFLDILLAQIFCAGFERVILCASYKKELVREHVAKMHPLSDIIFSEEETPLGTGGALALGLKNIRSERFVAVNGDSFCDVDFEALGEFHAGKDALVTMAVHEMARADAGQVVLDEDARIIDFKEKQLFQRPGYINTGVYLMQVGIRSFLPQSPVFSLEHDLFPTLLASKNFFGFPTKSRVFDIGTPARYKEAEVYFKKAGLI